MILDVGCGDAQRGDVNVDRVRLTTIKPHSNFVVADARFLPFQDKAFTCAYASHVLEHVEGNPFRALDELLRVSSFQVIVRVPHRASPFAWVDRTHRHFFNRHCLRAYARMRRVSFDVRLRLDPDRPTPFLFFARATLLNVLARARRQRTGKLKPRVPFIGFFPYPPLEIVCCLWVYAKA